jgi:hypothetical protein
MHKQKPATSDNTVVAADTTTTRRKSWRDVLPIYPPVENLFPPMGKDELQELAADIKASGLLNRPTLYDDHGVIYLLEGINRLDACESFGRSFLLPNGEVDRRLFNVRSASRSFDPIAFVLSQNLHRRHLTADQKRDVIAKLIKAQPNKSDRQVAKETKSNRTTVGQIRKKLESAGDVSIVDTRTDTKGRKQPAKKPKSTPMATGHMEPVEPVTKAEEVKPADPEAVAAGRKGFADTTAEIVRTWPHEAQLKFIHDLLELLEIPFAELTQYLQSNGLIARQRASAEPVS